MYNVSVNLFLTDNASQITHQIASIIERATGQRVRVILVDNKIKNQKALEMRKNIEEKLLTQKPQL